MDADLRALEREAAGGDEAAVRRLAAGLARAGRPAEAWTLLRERELSDAELEAELVEAQRAPLDRLAAVSRSHLLLATGELSWGSWSWSEPRSVELPGVRPRRPVLAALLHTPLSRARFDDLLELTSLVELLVRAERFGDTRVADLVRLPCLRKLEIGGTRVTDRGLRSLAPARSLRLLSLTNGKATDVRQTARGVARLLRERPDLTVWLDGNHLAAVGDEPLAHRLANLLLQAGQTPSLHAQAHELALVLLELDPPPRPPTARILPLVRTALTAPSREPRSAAAQVLYRLAELGADLGSPLPELVDDLGDPSLGPKAAFALRTFVLAGCPREELADRLQGLEAPADAGARARIAGVRDLLRARSRQDLSSLGPAGDPFVEWALAQDDATARHARAWLEREPREPALLLPLVGAALDAGEVAAQLGVERLRALAADGLDVRPAYPRFPAAVHAPEAARRRGLLHRHARVEALGELADPAVARQVWERARRGEDLSPVVDRLQAALPALPQPAQGLLALALRHHAWRHPGFEPPPLPDLRRLDAPALLQATLDLDAGRITTGTRWACWARFEPPAREDSRDDDPDPAAQPPRACAVCGSLETACTHHRRASDITGEFESWEFCCAGCGAFTCYDYEHER